MMVVTIGRRSDVSAYFLVQDARLYSMLVTVVIFGKYVCCSVVFGTHVDVSCVESYVI